MLVNYKKDYQKIAMGLLSYLPDFKNLTNLKEEMQLYQADSEFKLFLYRDSDSDFIGVVGIQALKDFVLVRYLSIAPGFTSQKLDEKILRELKQEFPKKQISTLPKYSYLIKDTN